MSENNSADVIAQIHARMEEGQAQKARKDALSSKKLDIDEKKTSIAYENMKRSEAELNAADNTNYGIPTQDYIDTIIKDNDEYMEAAKHAMCFICPEFDGAVPFFQKNLIAIGGKTGEGKSTAVANIVFSMVGLKNPRHGNLNRILILTNEEKAADFFNRITCLIHGWHYVNHNEFSDHQKATFRKFIPILARQIMVIDDNYNGIPGTTSTIEGIRRVFAGLIREGIHYDAVLLDYYTGVSSSKLQPHLKSHEVQSQLAYFLDSMKNTYSAPLLVMFQVRPKDDKETPLEYRMKGSKDLLVKATHIMEMVANHEEHCTDWNIEKSRFTKMLGKSIRTGYSNGKFVNHDNEFILKVQKYKEDKMWAQTQGKDVFKKKEPANES